MRTALTILVVSLVLRRASCLNPSKSKRTTYNYFAYGSNMALSTMSRLRNISPLSSEPAILSGHRLAFNVPGAPLVEPSWASVEPVPGTEQNSEEGQEATAVHGVLYRLSEEDFSKVCLTEMVPFAYRLHRCRVLPYNKRDGKEARRTVSERDIVPAFTLRAAPRWRNSADIPPSRGYRNVLVRGAREFRLDEDWVRGLEEMEVGTTAFGILELAEVAGEKFGRNQRVDR